MSFPFYISSFMPFAWLRALTGNGPNVC